MTSKTFKLMSAVLVSGLALASQSAFSSSTTTLAYKEAAFPAYQVANIKFNDGLSTPYPDVNKNVYVGGFSMKGMSTADQPFTAWCVDIFDSLYTGADGKQYHTDVSTSTINNFANIQKLANQRYGEVNSSRTSAAFQLAVWELVSETGSSFNLGSGNFKASGANYSEIVSAATDPDGNVGPLLSAIALANDWLKLDKTVGNGNYNIDYYFIGTMPNGNMSQNLISVSPVPLPAAGLLMASALGLGGLFTRRRASAKK